MLHTKLLMQRLADVPWLLAASLVLGWSGEAAAQTLTARFEAMPESHDGSEFTFELHFSEEIEMSYVNMRDDVLDVTGGVVTRARRLVQGSNLGWEIAIVPEPNVDVSISLPPTVDCEAAGAVCTADDRALSSGLVALVAGPAVTVQADLELSVSPASIREDADETDIEVTVEVTDDTAVDMDTYVLLSISNEWLRGLNTRFRISLTALKIPAGEKKATGTVTLIPVNDDIVDEDIPIEIRGHAGRKTVESATLTLIDDDKESQNISLSADIVELNRFDGATDIVVTATLEGKVLNEETSFVLTIGDHPDLTDDPNTDTDGDGDIDDADATKDNREAQRDVDYSVTLASLTIPRNAVSGTATITIIPQNQLPGTIRIESPDFDTDAPGIQIEDDGLTISPVDIKIKKEVVVTADAITLSQESIREDAGETTVEVKVTLTDALVEDETMSLAVLPEGAVLPSGDTVTGTPLRDVDYTVAFGSPLTIPVGATEGTTTFTITPTNDTDVAQRGTIYIQITVGDVVTTRTIVLVDDDTNSMNISLTAEPAAISEGAGTTDVAVTGTLDGEVFDDDVVVLLAIDSDPQDTDADGNVVDVAEATRDVDYSATVRSLTIPAGSVSGTTMFTITPVDDRTVEADEIIRLRVPYANNQITAQDAEGDEVKVTVGTVDITLQDTGAGGAPSFAADASIADQTYAVGVAIADLVLPEASGGDGELTYSVSSLPAGLEFDAVTRTLAGTPTEASSLTITYTVTDSRDDTATLDFTITIAEERTVPVFAEGTSIADQTHAIGVAIADLVLPEASGGDGELTYSVSSLPAGLEFDAITRTLAGTPTEASSLTVTYTVTDDNSATATLTFAITIRDDDQDTDTGAGGAPSFAADASIADQTYAVGVAIADLVLPEASGGDGELTYSVSSLPAGLEFDAATRTLRGTPTEASTLTVTYTVTDDNSATATLTFAITIRDDDQDTDTDTDTGAGGSPSTSIALSAEPSTISEGAGTTTVTVTATLDGNALAEAATVRLGIGASTATRDLDYSIRLPRLTIPAGSVSGTVGVSVALYDDNLEEGDEIIRLVGTISGLEGDEVDITIRDDDQDTDTDTGAGGSPSTSIALSAEPSTISEGAGTTTVTVTATLDGNALAEAATVRLGIGASTATRDLDYSIRLPRLTIPAGSVSGTVGVSVVLHADNLEEGDEIIRLVGTISGLEGDEVDITIRDSGAAKATIQTRPEAFSLTDNFPNPFNPTTTIKYALPQAADVELTVYNVVGQPVRTLVAEYQRAGRYAVEWDATNDSGHSLSSGMYFYRLEAGGEFREIKKMLLLK